MSKYARRVDRNQGAIISALVDVGASVIPMHGVGGGFPDLLYWHKGVYGLMEVKDETTDHYHKMRNLERCLTPAQKRFHAEWPGDISIVWTPEEAVGVLKG